VDDVGARRGQHGVVIGEPSSGSVALGCRFRGSPGEITYSHKLDARLARQGNEVLVRHAPSTDNRRPHRWGGSRVAQCPMPCELPVQWSQARMRRKGS
jgi:hypothetical protein